MRPCPSGFPTRLPSRELGWFDAQARKVALMQAKKLSLGELAEPRALLLINVFPCPRADMCGGLLLVHASTDDGADDGAQRGPVAHAKRIGFADGLSDRRVAAPVSGLPIACRPKGKHLEACSVRRSSYTAEYGFSDHLVARLRTADKLGQLPLRLAYGDLHRAAFQVTCGVCVANYGPTYGPYPGARSGQNCAGQYGNVDVAPSCNISDALVGAVGPIRESATDQITLCFVYSISMRREDPPRGIERWGTRQHPGGQLSAGEGGYPSSVSEVVDPLAASRTRGRLCPCVVPSAACAELKYARNNSRKPWVTPLWT